MLSTAKKIMIARLASATLLRAGFRARQRTRRNGVTFDLDLREGIDLSLFLFGSFQKHVLKAVRRHVPIDGGVIDVGANIGAVSLPVAAILSRGRVIAVEPTDYAFDKLQRNISLNPHLSDRIVTIKSFIAAESSPASNLVAYSSWPVAGVNREGLHTVHQGAAKEAVCGQITLDDLVSTQDVDKVNFIKIDTDGHEFKVLSGAHETLERHKPVVLFEACEYLMRPPDPTFDDFAALLSAHGYSIYDSATLIPMDSPAFYRACPSGGSMDLIAVLTRQRP